jgi:DNA-binding beta-propeller fold protein YncE
MKRFPCVVGTLLIAFCASLVCAEPSVVLDGLNNPCGVAVQPKTGHVFVADSGNGRIIRVVDGKAEDVITEFPSDVYGKGPMYTIGPLGLAFLDQDTLVVGGGGKPDGEEMLRVYTIPAAGSDPIKADDMKFSFTLPATDDIKGEGNFYALAVTKDAIYVTCNGDDTKGWVSKADVQGTKVGPFKRWLATKEAVEVDAPVGITMSPDGKNIVVGQMGEITIPEDGLLSFYDTNGKLLLNLETGLSDLTALAYSPKGQLYALDFSWHDTTLGGLFQLIAKREGGSQTVEAKKIESLDKPTAMAFDEKGSLYITVIGEPNKGQLLKVEAGL